MPNTKSDRDSLLNDKHFKRYDKQRTKIIEQCGDDWKLKSRRIADLMFEPYGDFQKYLWDNVPEVEKLKMERRARGRRKGSEEPRIEIE